MGELIGATYRWAFIIDVRLFLAQLSDRWRPVRGVDEWWPPDHLASFRKALA
jgi:hypothetical protein